MKIIKPAEISGKIMTLIDLANESVILVSPYNRILNWRKLLGRINGALSRNISIEWYIRKDEGNRKDIESIGIIPQEIHRLHCKIYLNEKTAIISSMNLVESSDTDSLDIAMETETEEEYLEVKSFINQFISPKTVRIAHLPHSEKPFSEQFISYIQTKMPELAVYFSAEEKKIEIPFASNFRLEVEIDGNPRLVLQIIGDIASIKKQFNYFLSNKSKYEEKLGFSIDFGSQMYRLKFPLYDIDAERKIVPNNTNAIWKVDKIINVFGNNINFS